MKRLTMSFLGAVLLCVGGMGCSKDSGTTSQSYAGPGSNWAATLNSDGTFVITESTTSLTVNGNYTTLSTGFLKLTVTSAAGTGAPSAGDQAVALNVPGFVFLLKPLGDGSPIIPMVPSGSCPTADTALNWILTKTNGDIASPGQEAFGTFLYTASSNSCSLPTKFEIDDGALGAGTITGTYSCSGGIGTVGSDATMYFNPAGGAVVKTTASDEVILAMVPTTISSSSALDGDYAGLVFNTDSGGDDVKPIGGSFSSGTGTFNQYSDIETGATTGSAATVTISAVDTPSAGFFTANLNASGDATNPMKCMVTINAASSGRDIIFCIGQEPNDLGSANNIYNVLLVQK